MEMDITAIASGIGGMDGPIHDIALSCELLPYKIPCQKDVALKAKFCGKATSKL